MTKDELLALAHAYGVSYRVNQVLGKALAPVDVQPVICRWCSSDQGHWEWYCGNCGRHDDVPSPAPLRELSDDEIKELSEDIWDSALDYKHTNELAFARAVWKAAQS